MTVLVQILGGIVVFQLFFSGYFLLTSRKGSRLSNGLLSAFMWSLGFGLLDYFMLWYGLFDENTQFAFLLNSLVILHAPFLLLYTQSLTDVAFRLRPFHLLHLIPFLLALGLLAKYYYLQPEDIRSMALEAVKDGKNQVSVGVTIAGLLYEIAYLLAIKLCLNTYRIRIRNEYSNINKINLRWLDYLVNAFLLAYLGSAFSNISRHVEMQYFEEWPMLLGLLATFTFMNGVLLKGLHNNEIFLGGQRKRNVVASHGENAITVDQLKEHLEVKKPFINPNLTLAELADQLNVSARELSGLINTKLGQTFFDLINSYRIEEVKKMLISPTSRDKTILELMYEVGFNSKSSFNTAFKKFTGQTPSQYKENHGV